MPTHSQDQMLDAARRAVAAAAKVCRHLQRTLDLSAPIRKADESPVTIADFASQAIVVHTLVESLGPISLVGEESSSHLRNPAHSHALQVALDAVRPHWPGVTPDSFLTALDGGAPSPSSPMPSAQSPVPSSFWTLDPIDGTKGFLRRQQYSVCLAHVDRARPALAALACPNLSADPAADVTIPDSRGTIYTATLDPSVALEWTDSGSRPLPPRESTPPADRPIRICSSVEPSHSSLGRLLAVLKQLGRPHELVRLDSQCKYALVARGQADALVRLPGRRETIYHIWDHAPGAAIAAAAGCAVSDARGQPLDFGAGPSLARNLGVVCAAPWLHAELIDAIRRSTVLPA